MPFTHKVQPTLSENSLQVPERYSKPPQERKSILQVLLSIFRLIAIHWHHIHIGNRAHYSVERLLAFRDYYERTSPIRVFLVCIFTPIPALTVMLLIECIPLNSPDEGWQANYTFWIRMLVASFFVAGGIVFFAKAVIEEGVISTARCIGIAGMSAICYTALGIFLAATWKFPIPFGMVLMVFPFVTVIMNLLLLCIGPRVLMTNLHLQNQLVRHIIASTAQSLLVVAYPTFNAIFVQLSGVEQAVFIFVLPVVKFFTKQIIARTSSHVEDCLGVIIVFSVDVFNVLYVSICLQTARSSLTTMLVVSFDVCHIVMALRTIYYHTAEPQHEGGELSLGSQPHINSLDKILSMLKSQSKLKPRRRPYSGPVRIFAPYNLPLSDISKAFLEELEHVWHFHSGQITTTTSARDLSENAASSSVKSSTGPSSAAIPTDSKQKPAAKGKVDHLASASETAVMPVLSNTGTLISPTTGPKLYRSGNMVQDFSVRTHKNIYQSHGAISRRPVIEKAVEEGLQVFFHCEYVILAEYAEFMLPLLYAGYLVGLFHLPTKVYYPSTQSLTPVKMISTLVQLVVYGSLELLSFVGLHVLLKKRLGYSPTYQLAFVLETHVGMVQSLMFVWIIFILPLTLVHCGVDYNALFI